jgi:prolyl oligopeptidase PreP (S9A serine peptidase family)
VAASKLPGKEIGFGSRTLDESLWLVSARSDTEPAETYLYDRKAKTLVLAVRLFEKLPRESLAAMQVVKYKSSDGLEIPAYLTLPKGVPAKALPLLVIPHGGPWARDNWGYNPLAQFFANRGYAVLMPNFRGSTGYGKKYLNAGNGEWGRKMQDDLTWGVKYLVAEGTRTPSAWESWAGRTADTRCWLGLRSRRMCIARRWTLWGRRTCRPCWMRYRRIGRRGGNRCTRAWRTRGRRPARRG